MPAPTAVTAVAGAGAGAGAGAWPRRRLAVVVQRYGEGLLGGAEWHAASMVRALSAHHDVTVMTSCARNATVWDLHYPPGESVEGGVRVWRFTHPPRNEGGRARVPLRHKLRFLARRWLDALGLTRVPPPRGDDRLDGHEFLRRQGPCCTGLVEAMREAQARFDAVVFFTALYHPTAEGLPAWGKRSLLVPTLHDEKAMHLPVFHATFRGAGHVLWNTAAEQRLARRLYGDSAGGPGSLVGAAVETVPPAPEQVAQARHRHGLPERYVVYVGRVESGKGCAELLAAWRGLGGQVAGAALVFVGQGGMQVPAAPDIVKTGFVDATERDALVAGAAALVMPSRLESLSLALLEAMALGAPVLANGRCEPLADHVAASGAGQAYRNRRELRAGLRAALTRSAAERTRLGESGRRYVAAHYSADGVRQRWLEAVEQVCAAEAPL